jgi:hypothetical protein
MVKKIGPIRCPETSVKYYHSILRNKPEDRRSNKQTLYRTYEHNAVTKNTKIICRGGVPLKQTHFSTKIIQFLEINKGTIEINIKS